jgi:type IV pilus assembly protein PilC
MLFHYKAFNRSNVLVEGDIEMNTKQDVLTFLYNQSLKPINIKVLEKKINLKNMEIFAKKITLKDKVFLFKYLALMLSVGTDLVAAMRILLSDYTTGPIHDFLFEVKNNLEKGLPFSLAFEQNPQQFSLITANLIKAGEKSGNLQEVFEKLSYNLEKNSDLQTKVKSSLSYPIILIVMCVLLVYALLVFIFPQMGSIFKKNDMDIPGLTKFMMTLSDFLNANMVIVTLLMILLPIVGFIYFTKTQSGKKTLNSIINFIKPIRILLEKIILQRLCSTLASLIKSGMPIITALQVTSKTLGNIRYEEAMKRIVLKITRGTSIGESFKAEAIFPSSLVNLISIGEKAGSTYNILVTLADFYEKEIDASLKSLVSLIEPTILIFMGVMVGGIAISVVMPMYKIVGTF